MRKLREAAGEAKQNVRDLFGEGAEERGLVPLSPAVVDGICAVVDHIGKGNISCATLQIIGVCIVKLKADGSSIQVERSEGKKVRLIAGTK